ncbi:hypothetical protein [Crocinitomix catalasitica]|uniref:hypothetical protein n=1 Tax=Crocinitomix catalasitica TaxID=184607 RepID=UPI0004895085|nr:hypothetical protein [Crocinitomix catalasitica]
MKLIIAILSLSIVLNNYAQDSPHKNRIGIIGGLQINNFDYGKFGFEFQHSIQPKLKLNISATYDNIQNPPLMDNVLAFESEILRIYRTQKAWDRLYIIRGGLDYEPNKYLSFGTNLVIGYNRSVNGIYDEGSAYSTITDTWEDCNECAHDYHDNAQREQDNGSLNLKNLAYARPIGKNQYFVYGLSLNIGARFPIKNRWELGLFYSPELTRNKIMKRTLYYEGTDLLVSEFNSFTRFQHYIDVKLRFKI